MIRDVGHLELPAEEERRDEELGHALGQRRDRPEDERGRPAEEDRERERLSLRLGGVVVEPAALADLPVDARRARAVDLDPVHPEVRLAGLLGVFRIDERQREERSAVSGPLRQGGQRA